MEKITIHNFRKIKNQWDINLSPITFFVGTNNSGKSSVLKALMLLDGFGNSKNHFVLNFNGKHSRNHKIDCYTNAINRDNFQDKQFDIKFSVENQDFTINYVFYPFDDNDGMFEKGKLKFIEFINKNNNSKLSCTHLASDEYQITVDNIFIFGKNIDENKTEQELNKYFILKQDIESKIESIQEFLNKYADFEEQDLIFQLNKSNELKLLMSKQSEINKLINSLKKNKSTDFFQFNPTFKLSDYNGYESFDRILRIVISKYFHENETKFGVSSSKEMIRVSIVCENLLNILNFNISHLTPNRNTQTRLYVNENGNNDIHNIIKYHSENPIDKKSDAAIFLKEWMRSFDIGDDFRIKSIEGLASIIEIKEGKNWINLVDKGFGAGQVFTILLHIATVINDLNSNKLDRIRRLRRGLKNPIKSDSKIIVIEEPEANLHPKLQSELAKMLYEVWKKYRIQFIVETHSEYIIRKSQLLFLEHTKIKNNNEVSQYNPPFAVYYFDKLNGPYKMNFREDGRFTNEFGTGFFDENSNLIFDLP